jgi:hypothetical protein
MMRGFFFLVLFGATFLGASPLKTDFGGTFKSIASYQRLRQKNLFRHDSQWVSEQRLRLKGSATFEWFHLEAAHETSLFFQESNDPYFSIPSSQEPSFWDAEWHPVDKTWMDVYHKLDRAFLKLNLEPVEIIAGKQVVSLGVSRLFAAVSQVPRHAFVVVDPEYPRTEDALSVIWSGTFGLEGRFLPKLKDQREHNFHLRAKGNKSDYDFALTTGRSDDKIFIGLETAGNLGDALLFAEIVGYDVDGRNYGQGLVGIDQALSPKWKYIAEFFYNGFGKRKSDYRVERYLHRSAPYRGNWYGGLSVTWETTDLLKTNLITIANIVDPSFLLNLSFNYSLGNSTELLLGQYLSLGEDDAEFGGELPLLPAILPGIELGLPDLSYLALKWYF